jgi:hypothetical protein
MIKREYIALGAFAAVLLYAYSQGVFSKEKGQQLNPVTTVTDGSVPTLDEAQYKNKATNAHDSLQSYFQGYGGDLWTICNDLNALKDADLIETANAYAKLYPNDDNKTLYSLIQSVTAFYFSSTYTLKYELLERMKKLGL